MRTLGVLLLLAGSLLMLLGLGAALLELVGVYRGVLDDAMATRAVDENTTRPVRMLIFAAAGAVGFVPALAGIFVLRIGIVRARRAGRAAGAGR